MTDFQSLLEVILINGVSLNLLSPWNTMRCCNNPVRSDQWATTAERLRTASEESDLCNKIKSIQTKNYFKNYWEIEIM